MINRPSADRLLFWLGLSLVALGIWQLLSFQDTGTWQNASYPGGPPEPPSQNANYLGWGTLLLGFFTLASSHYFKLREARRADRAEAREIARERRSVEDTE